MHDVAYKALEELWYLQIHCQQMGSAQDITAFPVAKCIVIVSSLLNNPVRAHKHRECR